MRLMALSAVLIVVLMPVHAFLSTWLGTKVGPLLLWKSWKEILLAVMIPIVIIFCVLRKDIAKVIWSRGVNKLIAIYTLLHLVMVPFTHVSATAVVAGLMMNLRFLAIFVLVQIVVEARPEFIKRVRAAIPTWLLWTGAVLGVLALLQVYILPKDFLGQFGYDKNTTIAPYILVDQNPHALRAFATLRGPNTLGAYLLLPVAAALFVLSQKRRNVLGWASAALGFIGIYLTGSRSAWLGLVVAIAVLALMILPRADVVKWSKRLAVPVVALLLAIGWAAVNVPSVRLAVFHSSPGDSSLNEGSNDKHWEATANGIAAVVRHPLGTGPGSAGPATFYSSSGPNLSEDYYVQIAQEVGIIGLALFVGICVLVVRNIVRRTSLLPAVLMASFAGISLINFFLHGWADDPTALTWWALAGLYMSKA